MMYLLFLFFPFIAIAQSRVQLDCKEWTKESDLVPNMPCAKVGGVKIQSAKDVGLNFNEQVKIRDYLFNRIRYESPVRLGGELLSQVIEDSCRSTQRRSGRTLCDSVRDAQKVFQAEYGVTSSGDPVLLKERGLGRGHVAEGNILQGLLHTLLENQEKYDIDFARPLLTCVKEREVQIDIESPTGSKKVNVYKPVLQVRKTVNGREYLISFEVSYDHRLGELKVVTRSADTPIIGCNPQIQACEMDEIFLEYDEPIHSSELRDFFRGKDLEAAVQTETSSLAMGSVSHACLHAQERAASAQENEYEFDDDCEDSVTPDGSFGSGTAFGSSSSFGKSLVPTLISPSISCPELLMYKREQRLRNQLKDQERVEASISIDGVCYDLSDSLLSLNLFELETNRLSLTRRPRATEQNQRTQEGFDFGLEYPMGSTLLELCFEENEESVFWPEPKLSYDGYQFWKPADVIDSGVYTPIGRQNNRREERGSR